MLFKKMEEVLQYAEMTTGVNFASVKGTINNVEQWHILPILDKALYTSLNTAYTNTTLEADLTNPQKKLLLLCRNIIGSYLCYYYAPKAEVKLSDAGVRRMENDTAKSAYQYQVTNFRAQHLREGEQHCETLLSFLDENKSDYPDWVDSKAFAKFKLLFIKSASEFNDIYTTASPFRNFFAMRFKMVDVEIQIIKQAITAPLFGVLKGKDLAAPDTFTEAENELLSYLKKAIAYYTVAFALPYLAVRFDENGITITSEQGRSTNDNLGKIGDAGDVKISNLIRRCTEDGRQWLQTASTFINDNLSEFPTFEVPTPVDEQNLLHDANSSNNELDGSFGLV
jgi:hypothetical protein